MKPFPSSPLFRRLHSARRTRRVLLLVQQGDTLHAFDGSTPLPPLEASLPDAYDEIRLCLSASNLFFRVWTFPFRSRSKILQALRLLMSSELPFDPETLEHALLIQPDGKKETVVLSASIHKVRLHAMLETLRDYGIEPDVITADPFPFADCLINGRQERPEGHHVHCLMRENHSILLYMQGKTAKAIHIVHTGWNTLLPHTSQEQAVLIAETVRTHGFQVALEKHGRMNPLQANASITTLHTEAVSLFRQYAPEEEPDVSLHCELFADAKTASFFSESRCASTFMPNGIRLPMPFALPETALLRCGSANARFPAPKKHSLTTGSNTFWKLGILTALVAGSALLFLLAEGSFFSRKTAALEAENAAAFRKALPELGGRGFGSVQMESILRQRVRAQTTTQTATEGSSVVPFLKAVHQALDASFPVRFNTFRLSQNVASLAGTTDSYETVNRMRDTLSRLEEVQSVRLLNAGTGTVATGKRSGISETRSIVFELEVVLK